MQYFFLETIFDWLKDENPHALDICCEFFKGEGGESNEELASEQANYI